MDEFGMPVEGLGLEVGWIDYDSTAWREHPDPDPDEGDDDEVPTPEWVKAIAGLDPDEEGWGDGGSKSFCPTGPGGGVDPSCSPGEGGSSEAPARMSSQQVLDKVQELGKENEARQESDKVERKKLTDEFKALEARYKAIDVPKDPAAYQAAQQAWLDERKANPGQSYQESMKSPLYAKMKAAEAPADPAAVAAAREKMQEQGRKVVEFNEKSREGADRIKEKVMEAIRVPQADRCKLEVYMEGKAKKAVVESNVELFQELVSKDALGGRTAVSFQVSKEDGRASYSDDDGVKLFSGSGKKTVLHEMGHWLEHKGPDIQQAFVAYRRRVTEGYGNRPKPLGKGYRDDEVYKERTDGKKWINKYMGKLYSGSSSTELLSMGLELLATKPTELAERDPELFKLVVSACRGELRKR